MADKDEKLRFKITAKDEASSSFAKVATNMRGMVNESMVKTLGSALGIGAALKLAGRAMSAMATESRTAAEGQVQAASDIVSAQAKVRESWAQTAGAIPLIGEGLRDMMMAIGDVAGMKALSAAMKEGEQQTLRTADAVAKLKNENAMLALEIAGVTRAEMEQEKERQAREQRRRDVAAAEETLKKQLAIAKELREKLNELQGGGFVQGLLEFPKFMTGGTAATAKGQIAALGEALTAQMAQVAKASQALEGLREQTAKRNELGAQKVAQARQRELETEAAAQQAALAQQAEQERRAADERLRMTQDLDIERLRQQGRTMEAELLQADRHYADLAKRAQDDAVLQAQIASTAEGARAAIRQRHSDEEKRKADAARAERLDGERRNRDEVEQIILQAAGKGRLLEERRIREQFAALKSRFAGDPTMRRLLDLTEQQRLAETAKPDQATAGSRETSGFVSRFLTRAPESVVPAWAAKQNKLGEEQNRLLTELVRATKDGRIVIRDVAIN